MKILITGASGYIAGRLIAFLGGNREADLIAGSRRADGPSRPGLTWLAMDYSSREDLRAACEGVHTIVHLAGTDAQTSKADPVAAYQVNAVNTGRLIQASIESGVSKFIYLSTIHVYGSGLSGVVREEDCPRNGHPYAASHRAGEEILAGYLKDGLIEGCSVRLSNSFGLPANGNSSCWNLVVNDLARQVGRTGAMSIQSDGKPMRDIVPLSAVCKALDFLIYFDGRLSVPALNMGSGRSLTIREIASRIGELYRRKTGREATIRFSTSESQVRPEGFTFSIGKLQSLGFNIEPDYDSEINPILDDFLLENQL